MVSTAYSLTNKRINFRSVTEPIIVEITTPNLSAVCCNSLVIVNRENSDISKKINSLGLRFIIKRDNSLPIDPPAPVTRTTLFLIFFASKL